MSEKESVTVDEIREAVSETIGKSCFTIKEIREELEQKYPGKKVYSMVIIAYLSQLERAGLVEKCRGSGGRYLRHNYL